MGLCFVGNVAFPQDLQVIGLLATSHEVSRGTRGVVVPLVVCRLTRSKKNAVFGGSSEEIFVEMIDVYN